ncbi:hypothetical protein [Streptomyces sp. NPDC004050]
MEVAVARGGLAQGEPCGRQACAAVGDAEQDAVVRPVEAGPVAADDDDRAPGAGGDGQADRAQQEVRDLAPAP